MMVEDAVWMLLWGDVPDDWDRDVLMVDIGWTTRSRCVQHATILALCRLKKIEVWRVWEDERWQVERRTHHDTDASTIHKTNRFTYTYTNNLRIDIIPLDGRRSLVWKLKSLVVVRGPRRHTSLKRVCAAWPHSKHQTYIDKFKPNRDFLLGRNRLKLTLLSNININIIIPLLCE